MSRANRITKCLEKVKIRLQLLFVKAKRGANLIQKTQITEKAISKTLEKC